MSDNTNTSGDESVSLDLTNPAVKAAVEKMVNERVESTVAGLKGNRDAVLEEKRQKAEEANRYKQLVESLGGEDEIKKLSQRRQQLEEVEDRDLLMTDPAKWAERRNAKQAEAFEKQFAKEQKAREEAEAALKQETAGHKSLKLDLALRGAVKGKGLTSDGEELAVEVLKRETDFNDSGDLVFKSGDTVLEDDRGLPLTTDKRIKLLVEKYPSIVAGNSGGGAAGGKNGPNGRISNAQIAQMSSAERMKVLTG